MAEQPWTEWLTCEQARCIGIRNPSARMCLAHSSEEEAAAALTLINETGAIDARGVPITSALLERILAAAPRGKNGEPLIRECRFDRAIFNGNAVFDNSTFTGVAEFARTTFTHDARFAEASFDAGAEFGGTTFNRNAWFGRATFGASAWFGRVIFKGHARFARAIFDADARFDGARFNASAGFDWATFHADARFDRASFNASAGFEWATFHADAQFSQATFKHRAGFVGAKFQQARQFGPLLAYRGLILDEVQFSQSVQIEVSSIGLCCRRARFPGGVQFRLRWARVILDDSDLAAPSIVAGVPYLSDQELIRREAKVARSWLRLLANEISERPQLLSLRRANVAGLGLSNVSVAGCRFAGAHNLDKLRLESDVSFAFGASRLNWVGRRWGRREMIAEEVTWRANRSPRSWATPGWPTWLDDEQPGILGPRQIAGLYRALRKGREDAKDEPGAADFYYGEMEMRRARTSGTGNLDGLKSVSRGRAERSVLTAYWLVSGYGLRAWRAVTWLTVITVLLAVAFHLVGFAIPPQPVSYWTSLLYAFRATLSLTDDEVKLTAWGQALQGVLRLTGPVLLGLALLALRGRVKR